MRYDNLRLIKYQTMIRYFSLALLLLVLVSACEKENLVDTSQNELQDVNSLQDFENEISSGVSLVFFHASWCSICAEQRPAVESTSTKSEFSQVFFGEVEYEDNTDINQAYGVNGFPTIVFFKDGVEEARLNGKGHSEEDLAAQLNSLL